ncbi:hypothetical protein DL93DRAFT_2077244, partial [Clavulina sp. PMI_390]
MALYLIGLFLPHSEQFHFFMDIPYFLHCLSLPPSHPESIHPCLRYACYLGACNLLHGRLASHQAYFLERTRHYLDQSLMFADRITHFLWASMILACYFGRVRRLPESFVIRSSAARLASACGLSQNTAAVEEDDCQPSGFLLPPPRHQAEANDRIQLAYSIYISDQSLAAMSSYFGTLRETFIQRSPLVSISSKEPSINEQGLKEEKFEFWRSQVDLKASILKLFQRVVQCAISILEKKGICEEYLALKSEILSRINSIPTLPSPLQLRPSGSRNFFSPHLIFAHATLYGAGLILCGSCASEDAEARHCLLKYARLLADVCEHVGGLSRLHKVQVAVPIIHMMNATRIIAHELKRSAAGTSPRLSTEYCSAIESILDFLDDVVSISPAWVDLPLSLKDTLSAAANAVI